MEKCLGVIANTGWYYSRDNVVKHFGSPRCDFAASDPAVFFKPEVYHDVLVINDAGSRNCGGWNLDYHIRLTERPFPLRPDQSAERVGPAVHVNRRTR